MAHFIIAAGGTGMRLLESFVHQCAAGVYGGQEFNLLSIDTDSENKNRTDMVALTDWYENIKGNDNTMQESGLFSAKLTCFHYVTKMPQNAVNNMDGIIQAIGTEDKDSNVNLSKLVFSNKVRDFNLSHGYRAQTQLGSLHMYATILNSAKRLTENDNPDTNDFILRDYIQALSNSGAEDKVMIMGSLFGGTGASSVPILPKALSQAGKIIIGEEFNILNKTFGCAVMTDYFTFNAPAGGQNSEIIAKASAFRNNSQLALNYYNLKMKNVYDKVYIVGNNAETNVDYGKESKEVITGGAKMDNPFHYLELVASGSAYHFFNSERSNEAEYYYKTLDIGNEEIILDFNTFIKMQDENVLQVGFSNLMALELIRNKYDKKSVSSFVNDLKTISLENINTEALDKYLARFCRFYMEVHKSANSENLLHTESMEKANVGNLYTQKEKHFGFKKLLGQSSSKAMADIINYEYNMDKYTSLNSDMHKFLNSFYDTFNSLTKVNLN